MIILSKFKDYYDWLVSKYGRDSLIILDRRKNFIKAREFEDKNEISRYLVFIDKHVYELYFYKNHLYYTDEELIKLHDMKVSRSFDLHYQVFRNKIMRFNRIRVKPTDEDPLICYYYNGDFRSVGLKEFEFHKIIPADEMYLKIYGILSAQRESKVQDSMTDKEKIVSHGMDLKKSFRHRK